VARNPSFSKVSDVLYLASWNDSRAGLGNGNENDLADTDDIGHERSLTQIVFNAEGDLLFSAAKDPIINAWYTSNGERLGTFDGHKGTVWTVAVDCELAEGVRARGVIMWGQRGARRYRWLQRTRGKRQVGVGLS
jgi:WD40 repeat protein